ncbi:EamA family transporter [Kurthia massiliensis]|uniref:EamA family transporter n=1 Tax=Kurthia massiliensis TaxID=1033739 RepID=UPI0002898B19|nr:EamA family transporter [Kurthia massiliensis]
MNQMLVGTLFLTIASSIWGGMYVVVKIIVDIVPPIELIFLRYAIALLIIGLYMKQSFRIQKRDCGIIFLFPTSCRCIPRRTIAWGTARSLFLDWYLKNNTQKGRFLYIALFVFLLLYRYTVHH